MDNQFEIIYHETDAGKIPFKEWLDSLRDKSTVARIISRINRLRVGNFGDRKPVGSGVEELRLDFGPGYRVYFAKEGNSFVILLCGGDKDSQTKDIQTAKKLWEERCKQ